MNLEQLVDGAGFILQAKVQSVVYEGHPQFSNLHTVVVTLRVTRVLKGETDAIFRFRQWVFDGSDEWNSNGYRPGQEYLLLLHSPSRYGLTSPVGLQQGCFRVFRSQEGQVLAANGLENDGLFEGMQERTKSKMEPGLSFVVSQQPERGPHSLQDLTDAISDLMAHSRR